MKKLPELKALERKCFWIKAGERLVGLKLEPEAFYVFILTHSLSLSLSLSRTHTHTLSHSRSLSLKASFPFTTHELTFEAKLKLFFGKTLTFKNLM